MASYRQIRANRENAQKSTGPKTPEGKQRSRANALKHGLAGVGTVLPENLDEALQERVDRWRGWLKPFDEFEVDLCQDACLQSIRVWYCRAAMKARVEESWDDDRRHAARRLAEKLAAQPQIVAWDLEETLQGAQWKLEQWDQLAEALDQRGGWTDDEESRVFDLLGQPNADRQFSEGRDDELEAARDLIASERARLRDLIDRVLEPRDAREEWGAKLGLPPEEITPLKRLQRYERECQRRMNQALNRFKTGRRAWTPSASSSAPDRCVAPASRATEPIQTTESVSPVEPPPPPPPSPPPPPPGPAQTRLYEDLKSVADFLPPAASRATHRTVDHLIAQRIEPNAKLDRLARKHGWIGLTEPDREPGVCHVPLYIGKPPRS
jgi:hypothetical protein